MARRFDEASVPEGAGGCQSDGRIADSKSGPRPQRSENFASSPIDARALPRVDDVRLIVGEAVDQRNDGRHAVLRSPLWDVFGFVIEEAARELVREYRSRLTVLHLFEPLVDAGAVSLEEQKGLVGGLLEQLLLERPAFAVGETGANVTEVIDEVLRGERNQDVREPSRRNLRRISI